MNRGRIWVFDESRLEDALEQYQSEALDAYPQQDERIAITVAAIKDFLYSEYADKLTMSQN